MIAPDLPADLKAALARLGEHLSRRNAAGHAARISADYRRGGTSRAIAGADAVFAYASTRMPATYAAVSACLNALCAARPDFQPQTLLDVGAGPGTASWCAMTAFASLQELTMLDANSSLQDLAVELARNHPRFATMACRLGNASDLLEQAAPADLVIASYVIGEFDDAGRSKLVKAAWQKTGSALVIIEPGTPAGYARVLGARDALLAQGAHVLAPCPHDHACPLTPPDWCHFAQRLPRSRDHRRIKGAALPFEDEKFSYVVLAPEPSDQRRARILAPPHGGKAQIDVKLCTPSGLQHAAVPRRDRQAYARARRWRWGDAIDAAPAPKT